jgi:hypothetical protein
LATSPRACTDSGGPRRRRSAIGIIFGFLDTLSGLLIGAERGAFLFDGKNVVRVGGEQTGEVQALFDTEFGALLNSAPPAPALQWRPDRPHSWRATWFRRNGVARIRQAAHRGRQWSVQL